MARFSSSWTWRPPSADSSMTGSVWVAPCVAGGGGREPRRPISTTTGNQQPEEALSGRPRSCASPTLGDLRGLFEVRVPD